MSAFVPFASVDYDSVRALIDILSLDATHLGNEIIDLPIYRPAAEDEILCTYPALADLELTKIQENNLKRVVIYRTAANLLLALPQVVSRNVIGVQTRWQPLDLQAKKEDYLKNANSLLNKLANELNLDPSDSSLNKFSIFRVAPGRRGEII